MINLDNFQITDALSKNDTTKEQRKHIHELYEKAGGIVGMPTSQRDSTFRGGSWDYHLYIGHNTPGRKFLTGHSSDFVSDYLNFKPYEWWLHQLTDVKIIDNTNVSPINTYLDEQLKKIENGEIKIL
jgi:hypothetical protein